MSVCAHRCPHPSPPPAKLGEGMVTPSPTLRVGEGWDGGQTPLVVEARKAA